MATRRPPLATAPLEELTEHAHDVVEALLH